MTNHKTGGIITSDIPPGRQPRGYRPDEICPSGEFHCVADILRDMNAMFTDLGCNHQSLFSLLYLRTTEQIRAGILNNEFSDIPLWHSITQTFGTYYLDGLKAFRHDPADSRCPEAWRIAHQSAQDESVSSIGDIFLGINAHVNRDLAFVYYQIGADNYADHIAVNTILNRVSAIVYPEIYASLDPTIFFQLFSIPPTIDLNIFAWRDVAWNNSLRLRSAADADTRASIAREIEAASVAKANEIKAAFPATVDGNAIRDSFCTLHRSV